MTLQPEDQESIFTRIRDAIAAASPITNFSENSPERAISDDGFAAEMRERQHELLHVQLSARVDYAGKTITEADLEDLDIDPATVDLELLNSYQEDSDLDEFAKRNGVTRDPGNFATGTVTFQVSTDSTTIPEGTLVTTQPDADGETIDFETTEDVSPADGADTVDAPIQSVDRGAEFNVGSGALTHLPDPPPQVVGNPPVTNAEATTGGEDEETNAELRQRTKTALVGTSGGGTTGGVETGLVEAFDGLDLENVVIDENPTGDPQDFDVVVDGGPSDAELEAKIDELQPVAIEGHLVRPTDISIDVDATVTGTDVDTGTVEEDVRDYVTSLGLGDDVVRDQIVAAVVTADDAIVGIDSLSTAADGNNFTDDYAIGTRENAEAGAITVTVV